MLQPYQHSYLASRVGRRPELESKLGDSLNIEGPVLPPCRVCGDKASGFHYGAITCEACKNFFRRSLQRSGEYRCRGSGKCEIMLGERRFCSACRLAKCASLGMSKKAIKTGRYTLEKHAENIQEVKRLRLQEEMHRRSVEMNTNLHAKLQGFRRIQDTTMTYSNPNIKSENLLSPNRSRPASPGSLSDSAVPYGVGSPVSGASSGYSSPCATPLEQNRNYHGLPIFSYSNPSSPKELAFDYNRRGSDQGPYPHSPLIQVSAAMDTGPHSSGVTRPSQFHYDYSPPPGSARTTPSHSPVSEPQSELYSMAQQSRGILTTADSVLNGNPMLSQMNTPEQNCIIYSNGKMYQEIGAVQPTHHAEPAQPGTLASTVKDRIGAMNLNDTVQCGALAVQPNMSSLGAAMPSTNSSTFCRDRKPMVVGPMIQANDTPYSGCQPHPMASEHHIPEYQSVRYYPAGSSQTYQQNSLFDTRMLDQKESPMKQSATGRVEQWMETVPLGQPPPYPYARRTDMAAFAIQPNEAFSANSESPPTSDPGMKPVRSPMFPANAPDTSLYEKAFDTVIKRENISPTSAGANDLYNPPYTVQSNLPSRSPNPSTLSSAAAQTATKLAEALSMENIRHMETVTEMLTTAYNQAPPFVPDGLSDLPEKEHRFIRDKAERDSLFGPMKPVGTDEYMMIYNTTGIDVDGRIEISRDYIPSIEKSIHNYIRVVKYVPGFNELPVEDRSYLIKRSLYDCWILSAHRSVNVIEGLYTNQLGNTIHRLDLEKVHNKLIVDEFFRQAEFLQGMRLTTTEIVLLMLTAMVTGIPPANLQAPEAVETCRHYLMQLLTHYSTMVYPGDGRRLQTLTDYIQRRNLARQARISPSNFLKMDQLQLPTLLGEMIRESSFCELHEDD